MFAPGVCFPKSQAIALIAVDRQRGKAVITSLENLDCFD